MSKKIVELESDITNLSDIVNKLNKKINDYENIIIKLNSDLEELHNAVYSYACLECKKCNKMIPYSCYATSSHECFEKWRNDCMK